MILFELFLRVCAKGFHEVINHFDQKEQFVLVCLGAFVELKQSGPDVLAVSS